MKNKSELFDMVNSLREDAAHKQKRGIHFIMASVPIWCAILIIHSTDLTLQAKGVFSFFCSAPLVPLALAASKLMKIDFQNKENPLTNLGILFSLNQMLYILIAMWALYDKPTHMLMIYAMIFGAHLLPYGWLYQSKVYYVFAICIPILNLYLGISYPPVVLAGTMLCIEVLLCLCLVLEERKSLKA